MPELLVELLIAKEHIELKKTMKAYAKVDLLILDEWLIRALTPDETLQWGTFVVLLGAKRRAQGAPGAAFAYFL